MYFFDIQEEKMIYKNQHKEKIIELVEKIKNPTILKLIYGLVKSGYEEEKAGSE